MKKVLAALALLMTTSVFAAGGSEARTTDMFAPKMGSSEFLAGILLPTGKDEKGATSSKYSGIALVAEYGYGFSDFASFYIQQGYTSVEVAPATGSSTKTKGLGDTKIGVKAVVDFAPAFLYYDVSYQMALLEKPKRDSSGDLTAGSARPQFIVQVGAGTSYEVIGFGAKLNYNLYQDGDFDVPGGTLKFKSGTGAGWKIYAQYQASFKLGLSYSEQVSNSFDINTTTQDKSFSRTYGIYSIIPLEPTSEIFIEVTNPQGSDSAYTYGQYVVAASYRATF